MALNPVASTVIVISVIFCMLFSLGVLIFIARALQALNTRLTDITAKVEPLLIKADDILTVTGEKIHSIGDKAEGILAQGEEVAETVHEKVDRTATTVQRAVHAPLINLNSLAAGLSQGMATFGVLQRHGTNGNDTTAVRTSAPLSTTETPSEFSRREDIIDASELTAAASPDSRAAAGTPPVSDTAAIRAASARASAAEPEVVTVGIATSAAADPKGVINGRQ